MIKSLRWFIRISIIFSVYETKKNRNKLLNISRINSIIYLKRYETGFFVLKILYIKIKKLF